MTREVTIATEGQLDLHVARRLVSMVDGLVAGEYARHGKPDLLKRISGYCAAASYSNWLILIDLDNDYECAPAARGAWFTPDEEYLCAGVVVREIEAWLLADVPGISSFLGVSPDLVPPYPENLVDPKAELVQLAARSRRRDIRDGLVPRPGSGVSIGPTYVSDLQSFVRGTWDPDVARANAPSLDRCLNRLSTLIG